ncbi:hypothetical protein EJ06DRAFT_559964 [Trichodelitschia bisporula]|uniref:Uncharacterized protein n=1 Tax=Trichodelitschia bisporula TaxID=703511 RepID=A0A6G1HK06_9PEZI|nr:hypothetical protein EJ06DRAFT_559964 [Trichodelitschia bisporula]
MASIDGAWEPVLLTPEHTKRLQKILDVAGNKTPKHLILLLKYQKENPQRKIDCSYHGDGQRIGSFVLKGNGVSYQPPCLELSCVTCQVRQKHVFELQWKAVVEDVGEELTLPKTKTEDRIAVKPKLHTGSDLVDAGGAGMSCPLIRKRLASASPDEEDKPKAKVPFELRRSVRAETSKFKKNGDVKESEKEAEERSEQE